LSRVIRRIEDYESPSRSGHPFCEDAAPWCEYENGPSAFGGSSEIIGRNVNKKGRAISDPALVLSD